MVNQYPLWKNLLLGLLLVIGVIYAAPNFYGEDPAVQISRAGGQQPETALLVRTQSLLQERRITYKSLEEQGNDSVLVRFSNIEAQLQAKELLKETLGDDYTVALNLAPATPAWLRALGAQPMKWGLDLRGGVHFLLNVDLKAVVAQREAGSVRTISAALREANIRYLAIAQEQNGILIAFRDAALLEAAAQLLQRQFPEFEASKQQRGNDFILMAQLRTQALEEIRQYALQQTMTTLRNRVNELGISEAIVQQQGLDRIAVDLPGVQDTTRAKDIVGGTATLEFRLVDQTHDPRNAVGGLVPPGTKLYQAEYGPVLLKEPVILTGESITDAATGFAEDGSAAVSVRLGGGGESYFSRTTRDNVGKPMAVVYLETKITETTNEQNQPVKKVHKTERIISIATIKSALGSHFQITGLRGQQEALNLALLLRAGALPAPIYFVEESLVGPSLGAENIHKGVMSITVGFLLVAVFMALYYRVFGIIADLALAFNLVLLVAVLSMLGMTLTLPGMAGIVLTVGMAVDANVLIFERIREELRNGASPQASIYAGYERAFATIVDANLTTFIVAIVLFGIGTGAIKGFAITLSVGLLTSMLTGITFTRAMVNFIYGQRSKLKRLAIGI